MQFITNREKLLKEIIEEIIPSTENLYFLVGYFYFYGFEQLRDLIKDKNLKILIGMDIEKKVNDQIIEYYAINENENSPSNDSIRKKYCQSIKDAFETDIFDNKESYESFRIFK